MTANDAAPTTLLTLSPSRASDFKQCPQMYKFKSIDRIPTEPTVHQARGTTAHLALERLFQQPAADRTPENLYDLFRQSWSELKLTEYPNLFESVEDEREWGLGSLQLLADYFTIEDPTSFEPNELEMDLRVPIDEMTIRGILDRMETVTEADSLGVERELLVITDYKTGKAPPEQYAGKAFFALKIYALLIRTTQGVTPDRVRLLYLNGPTVYTLDINDAQLDAMHQQLTALWRAINKAIATDTWPARESVLCGWCDFKETLCPVFNTPAEIAVSRAEIDAEMAGRAKAETEVTAAESNAADSSHTADEPVDASTEAVSGD
ncbi:MAG: PD-(D/E)XK nuclease family protein [Actinomycetota bacterium]|nr:PD-(D/E)XK nuclease family protein [Actinomycetota bacterium]